MFILYYFYQCLQYPILFYKCCDDIVTKDNTKTSHIDINFFKNSIYKYNIADNLQKMDIYNILITYFVDDIYLNTNVVQRLTALNLNIPARQAVQALKQHSEFVQLSYDKSHIPKKIKETEEIDSSEKLYKLLDKDNSEDIEKILLKQYIESNQKYLEQKLKEENYQKEIDSSKYNTKKDKKTIKYKELPEVSNYSYKEKPNIEKTEKTNKYQLKVETIEHPEHSTLQDEYERYKQEEMIKLKQLESIEKK